MGGSVRFRTAQSARITDAKNKIDDFLQAAKTGKYPKVINANYIASLISATKSRDRNKVIATDQSAKADYMGNSEVLQKYKDARKAIIHMSPNDLNKSFKDEWSLLNQ